MAYKNNHIYASAKRPDTDLQVWCLGLIHNKPHQNVKLLIKWKRIPVQRKQRQKCNATHASRAKLTQYIKTYITEFSTYHAFLLKFTIYYSEKLKFKGHLITLLILTKHC